MIVMIGSGVLALSALGIALSNHEELKRIVKQTIAEELRGEIVSLKDQVGNLHELRGEIVSLKDQVGNLQELRGEILTLRNLIEDLQEDIASLKPYTKDQCLSQHDESRYVYGKCYFTYDTGGTVDWDGAREACASINATLTSPRTGDQFLAVYELSRSGKHWIGFHQYPAEGPWYDMEGYDATQNVEDRIHYPDPGHDCAYVNDDWDWPNFVGDAPCGNQNYIICED